MWKRRNGARVVGSVLSSSFGDLSSTTTSNEDIDSNDGDYVIGLLDSPKSRMLIVAKSPQTQYQNHEAKMANMRDTIKYLQHQLDLATDKIAALLLERGESAFLQEEKFASNLDSFTELVNRKLREVEFTKSLEAALRNVTAQTSVMLSERRDVQAELEGTTAIALATEIKMNEMLMSSMKQRKEIISTLKSIKNLIVFEGKKDDEEDDDNDVGGEEANSSCLAPLLLCWARPVEQPALIPLASFAKRGEAEDSNSEIFKELKDLYKALHRKVDEFNNNAATDVSEIDMLKSVISENTLKLARRAYEIETLKVQLNESKSLAAHTAAQHAELNALYMKVKVKLQKDVAETKAIAAAAEIAAEEQAEKHVLEKAELRAELICAISSYDNAIRKNAAELIEDNVARS